MILSFHPLFSADRQIICAGRAPGPDERQAISAATAVILPQACRQDLYEMVRENCALYFPNYDARFAFPGKTGQHLLFKKAGVPHPRTVSFSDTRAFRRQCRRIPDDLPFGFPCVFKFDWGGEGETVHPVDSVSCLKEILATASAFERTGQSGFLLQEMIPAGNRSLRVAVIAVSLTGGCNRTGRSGAPTWHKVDKSISWPIPSFGRRLFLPSKIFADQHVSSWRVSTWSFLKGPHRQPPFFWRSIIFSVGRASEDRKPITVSWFRR
jgi:hypothetical protein